MSLAVADDAMLELVVPEKQDNRRTIGPISESFGPQKKKYPYYDFGPILSRNAAWNFIVGGRGIGKSYGAKKLAIKDYIRKGEQFIYLRRFEEELTARDQFFADVAWEFEDEWDFRPNGGKFEIAPASTRDEKKREWETMGFIVALSTAQKKKSTPYPKVTKIIFDEFILEDGFQHYIPSEAKVMMNFYSTVDRGQDKTRVLFLANAVSMMNPYFIEWGLAPTEKTREFQQYKKSKRTGLPFICTHFPKSEEFEAQFRETRYGEFVDGSEWAKYAIGNDFADNRLDLVKPKNPRAKFDFNLETKFGKISVWKDLQNQEFWIGTTLPPTTPNFTMIAGKNTPDVGLLFYNDDVIGKMRTAYRYGRMFFQSPQAELVFIDLMNRR